MAWLLDTNVLSELRRLRPEPKVVDFVAGQPTAIQRRSDYDRAGVPVVNPWEAS
jgi:predicted nucleic acid-binding protein